MSLVSSTVSASFITFLTAAALVAPGCASSVGEGNEGIGSQGEPTGTAESRVSLDVCTPNPLSAPLRVWMANHMALLNALLQNHIPIDQTTLVKTTPGSSSSQIALSASQVQKDAKYKVRGILEVINAHDESRNQLNVVHAKLVSSGGTVFSGTPTAFALECNGDRLSFQDGGSRPLTAFRLPSASGEGEGLRWSREVSQTFGYKGSNRLFPTSSVTMNGGIYFEFDPIATPDGFAAPANSGSCTSYSTAAISSSADDTRFYNNGSCDPLSGAGCTPCNLESETSCSSRVVWRRIGTSTAWRCRAL